MGLQPWVHYIPIAPDTLTICNSIKKAMHWIQNNLDQAAQIGYVSTAMKDMHIKLYFKQFISNRKRCAS